MFGTRRLVVWFGALSVLAAGCGGDEVLQASFTSNGQSLTAEAAGDWELGDVSYTLTHHTEYTQQTQSITVDLHGNKPAELDRFRASLGAEFTEYLLTAVPASADRSDTRDVRFKQMLHAILLGKLPATSEGIGSQSSALTKLPAPVAPPSVYWPPDRQRPCADCELIYLACLTAESFATCAANRQRCLNSCY